ncbi:MAG: hypothetical protein QOI78_6437 [Actinomycetota bacterium]|nr:hypothetical protein [Actinomycetota bacterium]
MHVKGFGAGYLVDDVAATTRFYADVVGLAVTAELDWFASVNAGRPAKRSASCSGGTSRSRRATGRGRRPG